MTERRLIKLLRDALKESKEHHVYCGWGDSWERDCANSARLPEKVDEALAKADAYLEKK